MTKRLFNCAAMDLALLVAAPSSLFHWAERYANWHMRRTTAAGALTGAAVGNIAGNNRRSTGRGALVGGSAGLLQSNSRWRNQYDRYDGQCMRL